MNLIDVFHLGLVLGLVVGIHMGTMIGRIEEKEEQFKKRLNEPDTHRRP